MKICGNFTENLLINRFPLKSVKQIFSSMFYSNNDNQRRSDSITASATNSKNGR